MSTSQLTGLQVTLEMRQTKEVHTTGETTVTGTHKISIRTHNCAQATIKKDCQIVVALTKTMGRTEVRSATIDTHKRIAVETSFRKGSRGKMTHTMRYSGRILQDIMNLIRYSRGVRGCTLTITQEWSLSQFMMSIIGAEKTPEI
jgi:hypothetical protein